MLLHQTIQQAAQRRPENVAIRCGGESLSYGDLYRRAAALAHALRDRGAQTQDRVAVLVGKGFRVPESFYGALAAGATLVPIDPKSPVPQIVRILRAVGARHLLTEPKRAAIVAEALAEAPDVKQVLGVEEIEGRTDVHCTPWTEITERTTSEIDFPDIPILDSDPSYVLHTSGSTGIPKLIRHTHATAMSFVDWAADEYGLTPDDRLSNHSSHHTCFATFDFYCAARAGAATVILTPAAMKMPVSLSALMERERLSVWYSVPTALVQLVLRGVLEERDLTALRWVLFAGETFPDKHLRRLRELLPGARFSHVYGSTEVNVCTYFHLPKGDVPSPLPIGRACSNAVAEVVDDDLQPVSDGEEGELLIRGGAVMSGYWEDPDNPAANNERVFVKTPAGGGFDNLYFRTGDRVRRLDDGNLTFGGRADHQIKVRGHRVELGEVESALLNLDGVEHAAAFAVPDGEGSLKILAAVVASTTGEGDFVAELRSVLPAHAVPASVQQLDALPRTPTGKVDRKALKKLASGETNDG